jgi:hypothetical protein
MCVLFERKVLAALKMLNVKQQKAPAAQSPSCV